MSMGIAILACPYSGTHYIQKVLSEISVEIGHERKFGPDGIVSWRHALWKRVDFYRPLKMIRRDRLYRKLKATLNDGFSDKLCIVHQVRHPLMVISALRKMPDVDWKRAADYIRISGLSWDPLLESDLIRRAANFWLLWNTTAEMTASYTYQVERLESVWYEFLSALHLPADQRMPRIDRTVGRHEWTARIISWSDIYETAPKIGQSVSNLAQKYGYTDEPIDYLADPYYKFTIV